MIVCRDLVPFPAGGNLSERHKRRSGCKLPYLLLLRMHGGTLPARTSLSNTL
jgi:hypothetical protein